MTRKTESFRPVFDVEEVIDIVGYGNKSNFYNEAIEKEIEYRKEKANTKYSEFKKEVEEAEEKINDRTEEIQAIEAIIQRYEKQLQRLQRIQNKAQEKLIEDKKQLQRLKKTKEAVQQDGEIYQRHIEENREEINNYVKDIIEQYFNPTWRGLPDYVITWFNKSEALTNTFGTFRNFTNKYFYEYVEKEVLTNDNYSYQDLRNEYNLETPLINLPEDKKELTEIVNNRDLMDRICKTK